MGTGAAARRSHVEIAGEFGVLLDEVEAQLGLAAHQALDQVDRELVCVAVALSGSVTRRSVRLPASIVVSRSCARASRPGP